MDQHTRTFIQYLIHRYATDFKPAHVGDTAKYKGGQDKTFRVLTPLNYAIAHICVTSRTGLHLRRTYTGRSFAFFGCYDYPVISVSSRTAVHPPLKPELEAPF